jgi:hypothetical protein
LASKSDFTAEEWQALTRAPVLAAVHIAQAGPTNPVQLVIERDTMAMAISEGQQAPRESLVGAVVADMMAQASAAGGDAGGGDAGGPGQGPAAPGQVVSPSGMAGQPASAGAPGGMPSGGMPSGGAVPGAAGGAAGTATAPGAPGAQAGPETGADIIQTLRTAAGASRKGAPEDGETYRRWVVYIAQRVALAAPEGEAMASGNTIVIEGPAVSPAELQAVQEVAGTLGIEIAPPQTPASGAQPGGPPAPPA